MEDYDYSELFENNDNLDNCEDSTDSKKKYNGLKDPEKIDLTDFVNMLKESAKTDNEKARREVYMLTDLIEKDEINYWKLSIDDVVFLLQYAGYTEVDDGVKAFNNIHSREKFDKFMEERRKNSFWGRLVLKMKEAFGSNKDGD